MSVFSERLKEAILENEISQNKLALKVGVKQATVNRYANGVAEPNFEMLIKLCLELNVDPNFLLGFDDIR